MPKDEAKFDKRALTGFLRATGSRPDPKRVVMAGVGAGSEVASMRSEWPEAQFVGIEPIRENWKRCRQFWANDESDRPDDVLYQKALWRPGVRSIQMNFYRADQRSSVFTRRLPLDGDHTRDVPCTTLDWVTDRHVPYGSDALLWLDAEGAEHTILESSKLARTSSGRYGWLNIEITYRMMRRGVPTYYELDELIRSMGWRRLSVHGTAKNGGHQDAVYVPEDRWELIMDELALSSNDRKIKRWGNEKANQPRGGNSGKE